jgi:hypothetical protein
VEVYFSPSKACENAIISNINSSKYEIKIAIYDFTNKRIAKAVEKAKERASYALNRLQRIKNDRNSSSFGNGKHLKLMQKNEELCKESIIT